MIKIERVISVSSEDFNWPAENLLKDEGKGKWICKTVGEKNATVVLQLNKASKIKSIDVGNENSAFIEILVSKSCLADEDYKVLLVASSLMTLKEAKDATNSHGVRFFKETNFCKPESEEKWDRIKIVCSQPYNKHIQFGLSFIKFHGETENNTSANSSLNSQQIEKKNGPCSLGRFMLKNNQDDDIAVGSVFARRKELMQDNKKTSAFSIRAADSQLVKNGESEQSPERFRPHKKLKETPAAEEISDPISTRPSSSSTKYTPNSTKKAVNVKRNKAVRDRSASPEVKRVKKTDINIASSSSQSPHPVPKKASKESPSVTVKRQSYKPFQEFMKGVVFTISGFQNPLRSDIRNKALAMGARYKPDWDNTCTHLVCAFPNTPKFSQVQGHGKIIKKEWIESCYSRRIKFPWRRYALDPSDCKHPESEDEIMEGDENQDNGLNSDEPSPQPQAGPSLFGDLPKINAKRKKNDSPKVELSKPPKKSPVKSPVKRPKPAVAPGSSLAQLTSTQSREERVLDNTIYLDIDLKQVLSSCEELPDTESDSDSDTIPLPYMPEQFDELSFYIANDVSPSERVDLKRYIIAHSGCILENCTHETEYVIANDSTTVDQLQKDYPQIIGVKADWVWKCHDENRLLPSSKFEL